MAEGIAIGIAGVVSPVITQWIKNSLGWKKWAAIALALIVSFVIALVSLFLAGESVDWMSFGAVFGISQVVYAGFVR